MFGSKQEATALLNRVLRIMTEGTTAGAFIQHSLKAISRAAIVAVKHTRRRARRDTVFCTPHTRVLCAFPSQPRRPNHIILFAVSRSPRTTVDRRVLFCARIFVFTSVFSRERVEKNKMYSPVSTVLVDETCSHDFNTKMACDGARVNTH